MSPLDRPLAEIDFARRIVISKGMLRLMHSEAELIFLLAHEVAHYELSHRPPRSAAKRLPLELAADTRALEVMCRLGLRDAAARSLLTRLNEPGREVVDESLKELASTEVRARLAALTGCAAAQHETLLLDPSAFRQLIEAALAASITPAPEGTIR
ncbi:M48 family metalloprotease [Pseudomarimonas arenosa]|uniref:M48 family metalloprotease n=1 Tax=Pseudomarimonas arenosa TaxID=2774145 RepID=A0AAW3ZRU0_9GAMM|nr:M48 family metalloprotease [Pseudomarimonas arenosa]MBD8527590.1 M48 family metalloprotease [Pseudomarimonas arenosa]